MKANAHNLWCHDYLFAKIVLPRTYDDIKKFPQLII